MLAQRIIWQAEDTVKFRPYMMTYVCTQSQTELVSSYQWLCPSGKLPFQLGTPYLQLA